MTKILKQKSLLILIAVHATIAIPVAHAQMRPPPEQSVSAQFKPGQVWFYHSRPDEEASRAIIGRIEKAPKIGTILHVKIIGLKLKNLSAAAGTSSQITHVPITESALAKSVTTLSDEVPDLDGFMEGYDTWLSAYQNADGGVFTITLAEVVSAIKHVINQKPEHVTDQEKNE